jgi:hypothetical protein
MGVAGEHGQHGRGRAARGGVEVRLAAGLALAVLALAGCEALEDKSD